jgi:hypothetical protein
MSDAAIFALVFGGLLVLRVVAATVVFVLILPRGDHCPLCDAVTVRVRAPVLGRIRLAKRWCLACGWDGVMRIGPGGASVATKAADATDHAHSQVAQPLRKR